MIEPMDLDALPLAKSQQLLGWIYATLQSGQAVDAAEWNRAITTLTESKAA